MQALGTVWIGKYRIWLTPVSPFDSKQAKQTYYNVLLYYEESEVIHYYINLLKNKEFGSFRTLFNLDDRNMPTQYTDDVQYQAYLDRKSMEQPMWKLSSASIYSLFCQLLFLGGETD